MSIGGKIGRKRRNKFFSVKEKLYICIINQINMILEKDNLKEAFEYLKTYVTKDQVETLALAIKQNFPGMAHDENAVYGFAINRLIGQVYGGGETGALLRIENDLAKWLGYTFETQQDILDKEGFFNKIPSLITF